MQNRLSTTDIEFDTIELDPTFPITEPSYIKRGEISPDAPHIHNCFELGYCEEGTGIFTIEDKILPYNSGDIVVINHKEVHQAVSSLGQISTWRFFNLDPIRLLTGHIQSEGYTLETESLYGPGFENIIHSSEHPDICSTVKEIITEMNTKSPNYKAIVRSLVFILLLKLHRLPKHELPDDIMDLKRNNITRISPAIRYIADHFSKPLDLDQLAKRCHLSSPHFRKVFREATGVPPSTYITNFRMKAATIMLKNSDKKIIDIAYSCGYSTLSCFNRTFKSTFGMSPRTYRSSNS